VIRYHDHTPESRRATVALLTARTDSERTAARNLLAAIVNDPRRVARLDAIYAAAASDDDTATP